MTLDRWRGTRGVLGWLTMRWDVWQLKRFTRKLQAIKAADCPKESCTCGSNNMKVCPVHFIGWD